MTDNELNQLMQRVLLDAIKSDCEKEVPSRFMRKIICRLG